MVYISDFESFVMADLPGIIEEAHTGKGLGLRFLRHIERTSVLLFVIPVLSDDPAGDYAKLRHELREYHAPLLQKPHLVALSKIDTLAPDEQELLPEIMGEEFPDSVEFLPISAVSGAGLDTLKHRLYELVTEVKSKKQDIGA